MMKWLQYLKIRIIHTFSSTGLLIAFPPGEYFFLKKNICNILSGFNFIRVDAAQLIVCMAFNDTYEYFFPVFFALLQSKTEEAYIRLHQAIRNISSDRFRPLRWTLDFEKAHINVIFKNMIHL